jgi:hypothetical protein
MSSVREERIGWLRGVLRVVCRRAEFILRQPEAPVLSKQADPSAEGTLLHLAVWLGMDSVVPYGPFRCCCAVWH